MSVQITYKSIFNESNKCIIVTNQEGLVIFVNEKAEKNLDLIGSKIVNRHVKNVLPPIKTLVAQCLETGSPQFGEYLTERKRKLIVEVCAIGTGKSIKGCTCFFTSESNVETMSWTLESIKQLQNQWDAIFSSSTVSIWLFDGNGKILNVNKVGEELNGVKAEAMIGKYLHEIKDMYDVFVTPQVIQSKRQVTILQYIKRTKKYILVTGTPVFDETGGIVLVVVNGHDMTQLNALQEEVEQKRMMAEKFQDEFAEMTTVEMRNHEIIAENKKMKQVMRTAFKLARMGASDILLLGDSGTGKGLLAEFIHASGHRKGDPFVQINCAAMPESLLEAELFGYEKGAFTGADQSGKIGLFELAQRGTLFLDEIGDLSFSLQAKLLKYLDDHQVMRLGGTTVKKIDCTIIAATNRKLEDMVKQKLFRKDLLYRLNTFTVRILPLRERPEDIFELANNYLRKYNKEFQQNRRISQRGFDLLQSYHFPGNIRELRNIIKKAVVISEDDILDEVIEKNIRPHVQPTCEAFDDEDNVVNLSAQLLALEKSNLEHAISICKTTRKMANYLGTSQSAIIRKLKKHGLSTQVNR